jgi:hypothetical protein
MCKHSTGWACLLCLVEQQVSLICQKLDIIIELLEQLIAAQPGKPQKEELNYRK